MPPKQYNQTKPPPRRAPSILVAAQALVESSSTAHVPAKFSTNHPSTPITGANPLSLPNDDIPTSMDQSSLSNDVKDTGNAVWIALEVSLRGLAKCKDVFPPLMHVASALIDCVTFLEESNKRRQEYRKLATELGMLVKSLTESITQTRSIQMSICISNLVSGIKEQIAQINAKRNRRLLSRISKANQDEDDLIECYRIIETHFRQLQINASLGIWGIVSEQMVNSCLDYLSPARQARYNSAQTDGNRRHQCTPRTREEVLADLCSWSDAPDGSKIYWLDGMAGTGKTTIAYSLCDKLEENCQLGASFFCSRSLPDCRDVNRIFSTIAYQLSSFSYPFRTALCSVLSNNRDVSTYDLEAQFKNLVQEPLIQVKESLPSNVVVVIDALDECSDNSGPKTILKMLFLHAANIPVKFLITSRPVPGIKDLMHSHENSSRSILILHEIEQSLVQADIEVYLENELAMLSPSAEQVQKLAQQAGCLFIYAATAVRYICPEGISVDFHERLEAMLEMSPESPSKKHEVLNSLYTTILEAALGGCLEVQEEENIRLILHTIICAREPMTARTLAKLLQFNHERRVMLALNSLGSVLHVSEKSGFIAPLHSSFPDFMLSPERSGKFWCEAAWHNQILAFHCFNVMKSLRFNICNLESSYLLDKGVPDITNRVANAISPELFYACQYWSDHLQFAGASFELRHALQEFLSTRLLFWMEVLSLKGCISMGEAILFQAYSWLKEYGGALHIDELIQDARKFVTYFAANPVSCSTPHIYISVLPFWPKADPMAVYYWKQTEGLAQIDEKSIRRVGLAPLATWATGEPIKSISISKDGTRIACGASDHDIRIWDTRNGTLAAIPFKRHTDAVLSVAFSPDGTRVASGSKDRTIFVWDSRTGRIIAGPFVGHNDLVSSVAFSPDGACIISGSHDCTVRLWDVKSGLALGEPIKQHTLAVSSVAFSSDGALFASGSCDRTIYTWNTQSRKIIAGPFQGHKNMISSIAFSPDGLHIVSASYDATVRIWDAQNGTMVAKSLRGHRDAVSSVEFSPDGKRVVSASHDNTICVWDAQSRTLAAGPFHGHTGSVLSACFSPDGTRVFSGSDDCTIRVWDIYRGVVPKGSFKGPMSLVSSVAFSPDGTLIASGSHDHTIHVWDSHKGKVVAGPFKGHSNVVASVVFSPDGKRLASGSHDCTTRVWNIENGQIMSRSRSGIAGMVLSLPCLSEALRNWDVSSRQTSLQKHTNWVSSVAFSPDGTRFASGAYDDNILVWDAQTGDVIAGPFQGHTKQVASVVFSPDCARIASGSWDCTIRIWNAETGATVVGPLQGHTNAVTSVAYSSGGTRIISGSRDHTIRLWDASTGSLIKGPIGGHTGAITSVIFTSDDTRIVSAARDCTIRVWDAITGAVLAGPFEAHTDWVTSLACSSDGTRIISGSKDCTIRIWDSDFKNAPGWQMKKDGWIITTPEQGLLLWVPQDLHSGLKHPQNDIVICPQGSLELNFDGLLLGKQWHKCYLSTAESTKRRAKNLS